MNTLRIALIADIHHGPDTPLKLGSKALSLLEQVVARVNDEDPDLVVDLGDRITDADLEQDERRLREVASVLSRLTASKQHLLGNHDLALLPRETSEQALGQRLEHVSLDLHGWHLVLWQVNSAFQGDRGLVIDEEDFAWLEQDLASTHLPAVVFTHAPLDGGPVAGNYYFDKDGSQFAGYVNSARARALLETSSVVACVSGHVHWNTVRTLHGIRYLTIQSLSECFTTYPLPAEAWALLTLRNDLELTVHGRDAFSVRLPLRDRGRYWPRPGQVPEGWQGLDPPEAEPGSS